MNTLKIIIGILYAVILATSGGIVIFYFWKVTRKPKLCDTCKWLETKNTHKYHVYSCKPDGRMFSEWNHEAPEYCKYYCKSEDSENGAE